MALLSAIINNLSSGILYLNFGINQNICYLFFLLNSLKFAKRSKRKYIFIFSLLLFLYPSALYIASGQLLFKVNNKEKNLVYEILASIPAVLCHYRYSCVDCFICTKWIICMYTQLWTYMSKYKYLRRLCRQMQMYQIYILQVLSPGFKMYQII